MRYMLTLVGLGLMLVLTGCFAKIQQLPTHSDKNAPVFAPLPDRDILVGLAVSGGGSRAATFAAGALEALADIRITWEGQEHSALEMVTHMSSVSGGSLATAYYAAKKPPQSVQALGQQGLSPIYQHFFSDFKTAMQMDFEWRAVIRQLLFFRALNPTKFAYSFSEVWDSNFFDEMTFSQLYEREKRGDAPQVILNGTIYNTGRRLVLTTLPPSDFSYEFANELRKKLIAKGAQFTPEGRASFDRSLSRAKNQLIPQTFEDLSADHRALPISLAVATSASFPPIVGPVTYHVENSKIHETYTHVGDGGLFDNLGTESLTTVFLNKLNPRQSTEKKGLIIVIDASYPFDERDTDLGKKDKEPTDLDKNDKGFEVFIDDPSRIVGIMEERANAYQAMLWHSLRTESTVLPDYKHLKFIILRHTEAEWTGYQDLPEVCRNEFSADVTPEQIQQKVKQIPTLFRIKSPCHGALLIKAAHKVVGKQRQRIMEFLQQGS